MYLKSNGWKALSVVQIANVIEAYRQKLISYKALRVYFFCAELIAKREAEFRCKTYRRRRSKQSAIDSPLSGIPLTYRRSVRKLKKAGLLSDTGQLVLTETALPFTSDTISKAVGQGRSAARLVPVPREVLRYLESCSRPALAITMLSYCIRGLSIRKAEIKNAGSVKARWIAETFGLSLRAVKSARAELIEMGWIDRDCASHQRKLNRTGAYFVVNLCWSHRRTDNSSLPTRSESTRSTPAFSPPTTENHSISAPLIVIQDNSGNTREVRSGVSIRNIVVEDLHRLSRVEALYRQAIQLGFIRRTESSALNFLAAAVRARECLRPGAVFMGILKRGLWHHITQIQEDRARAVLMQKREMEPQFMRQVA